MGKSHSSLKGRLLLDGGNLRGSWFHRTVVLVCQHDAEGAFGLVLNRPADAVVGDALVADLPETLKALPLWLGGPVQPGALSYLHGDSKLKGQPVLPGLELGHSLEDLIELGSREESPPRVAVFAGYAGWSPGQLDDEIQREAWLVEKADASLVLSRDPRDLWRRILHAKGGLHRLLADSPDDLLLN